MRILQLVTRRQLRGAEILAAELSDSLTELGHEVVLVALFPPGDPELRPGRTGYEDLSDSRPRGLSPKLLFKLDRCLHLHQPHVIQANGADTLKYSVVARIVGRHHQPLIYRNISILSHWLRGPLHRRWVYSLLKRVDHVVAVSEASKNDLTEQLGLAAEVVSYIPRAVRTDVPSLCRATARARLCGATGCSSSKPIIVHVGSFTPEKNHLGLLKVLTRLRATKPEAQLVLFGSGPLEDEIRARAAELPGNLFLAGARSDALELARGADLLVLFSNVEGMPGVILEAGARELPVVATDVGGVREVVLDRETGLLVPPRDISACERAVSELLDSSKLRARLGLALQRHIKERYELSNIVEQYLELYNRLLADRLR